MVQKGNIPWNKGKGREPFLLFCKICFQKFYSLDEKRKYCSRSCSGKGPKKYRDVKCKGCGVTFSPRSNRHWTCSSCSEDRSLKARVYRYGSSGIAIKQLFAERNGLCLLCDREAKCVDHSHITGKVRGVLCQGCNRSLGYLEIPGWLEKALEYLKRGK